MAERVDIEFRVEGTDEGADEVERFNNELRGTGDASGQATSGVASFRSGLSTATVAVGAATASLAAAFSALKAFGTEMERQLGIINRTSGNIDVASRAVGGLVSNIDLMIARNRTLQAGLELSDEEFAAVAEAAVNFAAATGEDATAAMDQLSNALVNLSAEELRRYGLEIDTSKERTEQLADALGQLTEQAGETETGADSLGGAFQRLSVEIDNTETELLQVADILAGDLEQSFRDIQEEMGGTEGETVSLTQAVLGAVGSITGLNDQLERAYNRMQLAKEAAEELKQEFLELAAAGGTGRTGLGMGGTALDTETGITDEQRRAAQLRAQGGRGGGGGPSAEEQRAAANADLGADLLSGFAEDDVRAEEERRVADEIRSIREDLAQWSRTLDEDQEAFRDEQRKERVRKEEEAIETLKEKRIQAAEEEKAERQQFMAQINADAENVLQPAVSGITDALSAVIAGTKSADEAFQGLLSSFLAMIAEQAALEAAKEYAAAIASFATQDYSGGALHLAAGAAWTVVAVAAGAASIATAPSEATPSAPEQNAGDGGGSSGTTNVYNISGPVVTAGSRDLAGREMGQIISDGQRRYGSRHGGAAA